MTQDVDLQKEPFEWLGVSWNELRPDFTKSSNECVMYFFEANKS